MNTNTKTTKGLQTTGHTDRHIIPPLRGFDPVEYDSMLCAQLQAVQMIKKSDIDKRKGIQTNI